MRLASPRPPRRCPGVVDRRTWLKVGGLSMGALVSGLEPSLTALFAAEDAMRPPRSLSRDFSVILFWANGGPSHLETFDLKPGTRPRSADRCGPSTPTSPASRSANSCRAWPALPTSSPSSAACTTIAPSTPAARIAS